MSGPVEEQSVGSSFGTGTIEVRQGREAQLGSMGILRVLPTKGRRTIGPWCFTDLMNPDDISNPPALEVGPHPHIGLATVTWLFAGSALHSDSLGNEQLIRPGELNLMTSGRGIAHAELGVEAVPAYETNGIMGAQMWLAQDEATRHGPAAFQHLSELPIVESDASRVQVLIGEFGDEVSPANFSHTTIGLDVTFTGPMTLAVDATFEHGVVPINVPIAVDGSIVEPGSLALIPLGRPQLGFDSRSPSARFLLLGGEPLGEPIKMWWNFVGRTQDELTQAWRDWESHNDDRFGAVPSRLQRVDAPRPPWLSASGT